MKKVDIGDTVYIQLSNKRYLTFQKLDQDPVDKGAKGVLEYTLYTTDGKRKLATGVIDVFAEKDTVYETVQALMISLGYRDEKSAPMLYIQIKEDTFVSEVEAAA